MKSKEILLRKTYPCLIDFLSPINNDHQRLLYKSEHKTFHRVDIQDINGVSQITVIPQISSIWVDRIIKDMQRLYQDKDVTFRIVEIWLERDLYDK